MRARFTTAVPLRMWKAEVWVDRVPNGDGGISIGQNAIVGHKLSS